MVGFNHTKFVEDLSKLIDSWYWWKYTEHRPSRFLGEDDMKEFIESVYDYSYYLFSKQDQDVMYTYQERLITVRQGGKKDDDGTVN